MHRARLAWIVGGAGMAFVIAAGLVACSSSSSGGGSSVHEAGTDSRTDSGGFTDDAGSWGDASNGGDGDAALGAQDSASGDDAGDAGGDAASDADDTDGGCAKPPKIPKGNGQGVECPGSKDHEGDGSTVAYCTPATQTCCISEGSDAGPSTCEAIGACGTGFVSWQCALPSDCGDGGNVVCCLTADGIIDDPKCSGYDKTKGFEDTRCAKPKACSGDADGGGKQLVVCAQQSDCPSGTCTAITVGQSSLGVCL